MAIEFDYDRFVTRNDGYVNKATQAKIRETRLLIAGAGLGSALPVAATRMGFQHFVLIDGDTVDLHNLNRQFFDFDDIGSPKVEALKRQILRINPTAKVETIQANLDKSNVAELVSKVDIVFDTIDFLDLEAILHLHGTAKAMGKHIFTALSIGFGAGVLHFPPDAPESLADILAKDVAAATAEGDVSYSNVFGKIMGRIGVHLDAQVVEQVGRALTIMEDGRPCPASQISVGSFTVGSMGLAMMHDMLAGLDVPSAPYITVHSFRNHTTKKIKISAD
ncbi:ThiF family adenylyltransferase [Pseudoduganella sp. UC29_71]|jgi:molybdopterin/thiamine biosynthesis adenylyltransferase|uniref:ThiF family adenylyltransferase n=1 Tax=Pseudoduganella sp. UC29_71 TaxID=3350174 RepID=UPI000D30FA9F